MKNMKSIELKDNLGITIILLPLLCYLISQITFAVGYHQTALTPFLAVILCCVYLYHQESRSRKLAISIFVCLVFGGILSATFLWDRSFDGTWYHADTQYLLARCDYNPFYQWELADSESLAGHMSYLFSGHYAKGIETISSCWVVITGSLESGKATNLFFIIGVFLLLDAFISSLQHAPKGFAKYLLLFIIIGNPVVINQAITNYIDWTSYVFLLITLICVYKIFVEKDNRYKILLYGVLLLVINVKINIAFWVCSFTLVFSIILIFINNIRINGDVRRVVLGSILSTFLGFIVAFNPYVTNYLSKGHPLYPLAGDEKLDIMTEQIPEKLAGGSNFIMVNKSLILNPLVDVESESVVVKALALGGVDPRVGGFGVFFSVSYVILLILSIFSRVNKRIKFYVWGAVFLLYLSLFLLPSGWWARYVAFFYLAPVSLIPLSYYGLQYSVLKKIFALAIILLAINSTLSLFASLADTIFNQNRSMQVLNQLKNMDTHELNVNTCNAMILSKMKAQGIEYERNNGIDEAKYMKVGGAPVYFEGIELPDNMYGIVK